MPITNPSILSGRSCEVRFYMEQHRVCFDTSILDDPVMISFRDVVMRVVGRERPSG